MYPMGQDFVMARIDAVDQDRRSFLLELAYDLILAEGKTVFAASLGGNAKIQFELDANWSIVPDRAQVVELPLPEVCQVLNRRAEAHLPAGEAGADRVPDFKYFDADEAAAGARRQQGADEALSCSNDSGRCASSRDKR